MFKVSDATYVLKGFSADIGATQVDRSKLRTSCQECAKGLPSERAKLISCQTQTVVVLVFFWKAAANILTFGSNNW